MAITTKLIKDGNSMAVRLPKALLELSGLQGAIQLEATKGKIVIKPAARAARAGWREQIQAARAQMPEDSAADDGFSDMEPAGADGLHDLADWNGPTYEEWLQRSQGKYNHDDKS